MFKLFGFGKKLSCKECPISLGASYYESKISHLEMKIKLLQQDLDSQSALLEFPFLQDAEFAINACTWSNFPAYIYQNCRNKYYISKDKKDDKLIKTYVRGMDEQINN